MKQSKLKPKQCVDCNGDAIPHRFTYFTILVDELIWSLIPPKKNGKGLKKVALHIERSVGPAVLESTVKLGLAKKQKTPDDETLLLACCLWEEADVRGITLWEWRLFGLARNVFVATYPNGKRIVFEGIPWVAGGSQHVWWMDDKSRLKDEFKKEGIKVAKGGTAKNEKEALSLFRTLTPPVIVKPHSGSGSRHTVLHIVDEKELIRAFRVATQVSPKVIVEEELVGPVYRATTVKGKFRAAIRRDPPSVLGDGIHTINELVTEENKKPGRSGPYFSKIPFPTYPNGDINEKAIAELAWQGMTGETVPAVGTRVHFHQKVNWSLGGTTVDVTDEVHPDNITLFEKASELLTAPIAGIDFIIRDISSSWKDEPRSGILECNSMPFFDNHHLPFEGKPRNVAAAIWDMVTPAS